MGILKLISFIVIFSVSWRHGVGAKGSPDEKDMELEMTLAIFNKPPTKSIRIGGDIYDCIDIYKQPALDHPLLKNHKIQMKPTYQAKSFIDQTPPLEKCLQTSLKCINCPQGTVPIRRTGNKDIVRANRFSETFSTKIGPQTPDRPGQHVVALRPSEKKLYHGVYATLNIHTLNIKDDQYSTAQMWVENGRGDQYTSLQAGWMVAPYLARNNGTRLFIYWKTINSRTGCFNNLCPGFVQVSSKFAPGSLLGTSIYGGIQRIVDVSISQDNLTGHWWVRVENITMGYWPKSILPGLDEGASMIAWGGLAGGPPNGDSPPMGNGHFPRGDMTKACFIKHLNTIDASNNYIEPKVRSMQNVVDNRKCYGLEYYGFSKGRGLTYLFGGPGGKCGL